MNMMNRLFDLVGKTWSRTPKDVPALTIRRGTGSHIRFTVDDTHLHFHTMGYHPHLPIKQSVLLDGLSLPQLAATIRQMGYEADVTPDAIVAGLTERSAITVLPVVNAALDGDSALYTFTSKLWETLFPVARLLDAAEGDINSATRQMFAESTRGTWLDYWASFFSVQRANGESDTSLASRMLTSINSLKTNNIALEEVLRGAVLEDVTVRDAEPALFEVELPPAFISQKELTDALIDSVKGAGIAYLYNYLERTEEHYPAYLQDKIGRPATQADELGITYDRVEGAFGWQLATDGFRLNVSQLNQHSLALTYKLRDNGSMTLTQGDSTVQSLSW